MAAWDALYGMLAFAILTVFIAGLMVGRTPEFLNKKIGTNAKYISVSHARRFGKSHAAGMIDAYYSLGSDSEELFSDTEIAAKDSFREHLNKYNVIHLDISSIFDLHKEDLIEEIVGEIRDEYDDDEKNFIKTMLNVGKTHDTLKVVNDQIGTPTYTFDLARCLLI